MVLEIKPFLICAILTSVPRYLTVTGSGFFFDIYDDEQKDSIPDEALSLHVYNLPRFNLQDHKLSTKHCQERSLNTETE